MTEPLDEPSAVELATELAVAWLSNPNTRASADDVPAFLRQMHQALGSLATGAKAEEAHPEQEFTPAVTARKSLASPDHIISMIDGKPYKTLRRHLARHGLTPEQYRKRYSLKSDYPMVSQSYSQVRRDMANKIGLGRKAGVPTAEDPAAKPDAEEASDTSAPKPVRIRRKKPESAEE